MANLVSRLVNFWPVGVVAIAVGLSMANGDRSSAPVVVAPTPQNGEALLDYVEASGEGIRNVEQRIAAIERVALPVAQQADAQQEVLVSTLSEFQGYDEQVWSLFDQMILAKSWEMFDGAQARAKEGHRSIEWELAAQATHLKDQLFELSKTHAGHIPMNDGPQRDQFSDAVTDAIAMSALLGQIMAGETPHYAEVNANELVSASKALSSGIYEAASQNIPLRNMANLPKVQPYQPEEAERSEVRNASN